MYDDLPGLYAYSARVASAVGVMMCVLMGVRDANALARAADLGVAMQLTNIARDVGEDAREGRVYLPLGWLEEIGESPESLMANPAPSPALRRLVSRLLADAKRLYYRSEAGISALPLDCRPGIYAARHIYAGIGGAIRRNDHDSLTRRAHTETWRKLGWLGQSMVHTGVSVAMPQSAVLYAPPLDACAVLVEAAAVRVAVAPSRSQALISILAALETQDRLRRGLDA
jgi:phytoene synthase